MRHEAIWLVQLLFVVGVAGTVFGCGVYVGWRRRGRSEVTGWDGVRAGVEVRASPSARSDLFAPEVGVRGAADASDGRSVDIRGELTAGG